MRRPQALLLLSTAAGCVRAADAPPRGVGPEFLSFYKPSSGSFQCISNPSVTLDFNQVNDDFCDCPDGSDEPGTSACAHLTTLSPQDPTAHFAGNHALPGFYCYNKGHRPGYIPFTNVNDGICDYDVCCDGSDEYNEVGTKCKNKCDEIGKEWRKKDEARQKSYSAAISKREGLIKEAGKKRQELVSEISALKTQIEAAEINIKQLEKDLETVEKTERARLGKGGGKEKKIESIIEKAKPKFEELQQALSAVRDTRDEFYKRLQALEGILGDLHTGYNPNFNDEGVKRVVRAWEEYKAKDHPEFNEWSSEEMKSQNLAMGIDTVDWDELQKDDDTEESDVEALYSLQAYLPLSMRTWLSEQMSALRTMLVDNGLLAAPPSTGLSESKKYRDASTRLQTARTTLRQEKDKLEEREGDLTKDYGPDDVFRTLKGTCINLDAGEYRYELCWLEKVSQNSKKGGSSQNMGEFTGYETIDVDDELPADGKGLGSGKRLVLKYEDGSHCWNGPARSTTVVLACAESEEIWKVAEEEKCVYRMEVGTPAVCDAPGTEEGSSIKLSNKEPPKAAGHDEL